MVPHKRNMDLPEVLEDISSNFYVVANLILWILTWLPELKQHVFDFVTLFGMELNNIFS